MNTRETLLEVAATLEAQASGRKPPARLFFLTDPERTPDPVAVAETLPEGVAVIYRPFGEYHPAVAAELREITARRRALLLMGADWDLAEEMDADGVHLPERLLAVAPRLRERWPSWVITAAAHSAPALAEADRRGIDAALVSPVFASRSRSAGTPLGIERFAALAAGVQTPVIALGGIDAANAHLLIGSGAAGLAAVEAWLA